MFHLSNVVELLHANLNLLCCATGSSGLEFHRLKVLWGFGWASLVGLPGDADGVCGRLCAWQALSHWATDHLPFPPSPVSFLKRQITEFPTRMARRTQRNCVNQFIWPNWCSEDAWIGAESIKHMNGCMSALPCAQLTVVSLPLLQTCN